jgi:hypothetical protein
LLIGRISFENGDYWQAHSRRDASFFKASREGSRIDSKQTNKALLEWVDNEKTAEEFEYRQRLRELGRLQSLEVQDAVNALGLTEEYPPIYATQYSKHPEKATVVDLFHVYAPDLEYASQK